MSITTALEARRDALREREAGFTLIELLVVVIIIGILAAIAIPVYLNVQNNAKDSAVKSDLVNYKTAIVAAATDNNGNIPTGVTSGTATISGNSVPLAPYGYSLSTGNTRSLAYIPNSTTTPTLWCVDGVSETGKTFRISSNTSVAGGTGVTCSALGATNY